MAKHGDESFPRFTLAALFGIALALLLVPESGVQTLRGGALSALRPLLVLFSPAPSGKPVLASSRRPADERAETPVSGDPDAQAKLEEFQHEILRLREENRRWQALLQARTPAQGSGPAALPAGQPALVIAREGHVQELLFGLDRGAEQGVRRGAGVLFRGAAVGRIVAAGAQASCMAPVTHGGLSLAARLAESRHEGVLQGSGGGARRCRMKVVGREMQAREGEAVITSGLDGAFPPGCLIGAVVKAEKSGDMEWTIEVLPEYDAAALEAVFVLSPRAAEIPWPVNGK